MLVKHVFVFLKAYQKPYTKIWIHFYIMYTLNRLLFLLLFPLLVLRKNSWKHGSLWNGSAIFYIERIIELMIKIVKSEKLMASKSNLSIYSIFMSWIIHLALQCGRFYIIKALKKSFFRQISTAFFTLWSWCYMFHHYFDDSFDFQLTTSFWLIQ